MLADGGRSNDFRLLDRELYLTATDLDTCERIVFGEEGWQDVPISKAIQCSTALPIVYKPVELKGRQLVDGGIRSTTNVDIAVEKGAKFIVVVNPLVPYVNDFKETIPTMFGTRVRRVSDMGMPAIANQTFRLIAHAAPAPGGRAVAGELPGRRHRPDRARAERRADVRHADHGLLAAASQIARHGFESVTATLAKDYDRYAEIAERTASRSPSAASAASSSGPPRKSPGRPPPGGGCWSRPPRCCCASPARLPRTSKGRSREGSVGPPLSPTWLDRWRPSECCVPASGAKRSEDLPRPPSHLLTSSVDG